MVRVENRLVEAEYGYLASAEDGHLVVEARYLEQSMHLE